MLQTVPGIIVDRVNVGGAESGQQSNYQAKGAAGTDNTWSMDGIAITDMSALGSSPTYYDFDMFQEMQVVTGGADPANPTPGVQLNFVLRGGTNRWRASGRYYYENNDLQSDNVNSNIAGQLQSFNRVEFYKDYGVEGGGPVLKDKLFVWGAYGKTNPAMEIYTFRTECQSRVPHGSGVHGAARCRIASEAQHLPDHGARLHGAENYSAKVNYNLVHELARVVHVLPRRQAEVRPRAPARRVRRETTWNQDGPTDMFKGEVNYTMSSNTFLTARYAYTSGGFSLEPIGGRDVQPYSGRRRDLRQDSYPVLRDRSSAEQLPDSRATTSAAAHEFKFGFGYRKASVASQSGFPWWRPEPPRRGGRHWRAVSRHAVAVHARREYQANGVYWSAFLAIRSASIG